MVATINYKVSAAPDSGRDFDVVNIIISVAKPEPKGAASF
jgi:hypothetical protein